MTREACERSVLAFRARVAAMPEILRRALETTPEALPARVLEADDWVVTGVGASAPPARWLAALLRRDARRCARFVPLDALVGDAVGSHAGVLVVFSQGLSPNARLALAAAGRFDAVVLVTASTRAEVLPTHVTVRRHDAGDEVGTFVRVVGPTLATLEAMQLAAEVAGGTVRPAFGEISNAVARAAQLPMPPISGRVAFVTAGELGEEHARGARWRWLEGLGQGEPPSWDLFQVAHGPFQDFVDGEITLVGLERASVPTDAVLFDRLTTMLDPARHRLIRCRATLPDVAGFFEHDALCNALLVRTLAEHPRDLESWPGKGRDGALYDLAAPDRLFDGSPR